MKKLSFLLMALTIALVGCKKDDDYIAPELAVDKAEIAFDANGRIIGDSENQLFMVTSNKEFKFISDVDWIFIQLADTPPYVKKNIFEVHLIVNNTYQPRYGTLTVRLDSGELEKTIKVSQAAKEHSLTLSTNELFFNAEKSDHIASQISVAATKSWEIQYENRADANWCHYEIFKNDQSSSIQFTVDAYKGATPRIAKLTVKMGDLQEVITVTQNVAANVFDMISDPIFKQYCKQFDTNNDNILAVKEANAVKTLAVANMGISSLNGIEYFASIEKLYCGSNSLTELNLSYNYLLTELNCENNQLTKLDLSLCNKLVSLTCSNNPKLTRIMVMDDIRNPGSSIQNVTKDSGAIFVFIAL